MAQQALFDQIKQRMNEEVNEEFIKSTKTEKGNTQVSERAVIEKIRQVLTSLSLTFEEAGSQQSKDFRNVGGIGLSIEVKKTDNPIIYFNDTCPSKDIYYIIFFTGKEYKRTPEKNVPPCLRYINGEEFIKDSPWIVDYIAELTALKDKYARGENKKKLAGIMEVYPRPTFKANISRFLGINVSVDDEPLVESQVDDEPQRVADYQSSQHIVDDDVLMAAEALMMLSQSKVTNLNESRLCDDIEVEFSEEDLEYYRSLCDKNVINDSNIDIYLEEIKNISQEDVDNSDNPAETEFYLELIKNSDNPSEIEFYLEFIKSRIKSVKNTWEDPK